MKPIILSEYPLDIKDRYFKGLTDGIEGCVIRFVQREEFNSPYEFTREYYREVFEELLGLFSFTEDEVFKLSYYYMPVTKEWFRHNYENGLATLKEVSEKYRRIYKNELEYVYVDTWNEKNLRLQKNTRIELDKLFKDPPNNKEVRSYDLLTVTTYLKLPSVLVKDDTDTYQDNSIICER